MDNKIDKFGKVLGVVENEKQGFLMNWLALFASIFIFVSYDEKSTAMIVCLFILGFTILASLWSFKYTVTTRGLVVTTIFNPFILPIDNRFIEYSKIESVEWNPKEGEGPIEIKIDGEEMINVPFEVSDLFDKNIDKLPSGFKSIVEE